MQGAARLIIVVHGPRDSGKSRAAADLAERLLREGRSVAGIISEAELSGGRKIAYRYRDLATGARERYAELGARQEGLGFGFLERGLAFGRRALRAAAARAPDVVIVDEVGPLEMGGAGLRPELDVLAADPRFDLVVTVRESLAQELAALLAGRSIRGVARLRPSQLAAWSPERALRTR